MKEKTEFEKFSDTTKRLLSVSKEELSRREAEWKKQRAKQRKSNKSSGRAASRDSDGGT